MSTKRSTIFSRRRLLKTGGAAIASATIGPLLLTERTIAQTRTVYVNTWGGSWTAAEEAAFFKPFTEATGIQIRTVAPVSYAKLKAQVQSGSYEWDITAINQSDWLRAEKEGLVEPIDWTIVQKDKLFPDAVFANGISYCALGTNLCYRKDKFPNGGPKSWADFWDVKKFPGTRSLFNNAPRTLNAALLADGVPADKVYPMDIDRAFKKLDQIKPHIKVWWTQGNQSQQLIRDGEIDMMAIWNARASELAGARRAGRAGLERRPCRHHDVGRRQRRAKPQAGLGIHPVRGSAQAAGGVLQSSVLRADQSEGLRVRQARDRQADAHLSGERKADHRRQCRVGGGQRRHDAGTLHPMARDVT